MSNLTEQAVNRSIANEDTCRLKVRHARSMRNGRWGMSFVVSLTLFVAAMWILTAHSARAGSGLYLSSELGANFSPVLDILGMSNDRASVCDEFINPMFAAVTETARYKNYNCTGPNRGATGDWENAFDGAEGILAGMAVGYSLGEKYPDHFLGRFRLEVEYFYRDTEYYQTSDVPRAAGETADKLAQEIRTATDRIDSVSSHNLFGNLYVDFRTSSRLTPYVGFGVGVGFTDIGYGGVWARNPDPTAISTGAGLPNAAEIRRNLAGTTSVAQSELSDRLFSYQVLFGVDYALTESLSVGLKGRWVNFESFSDGTVWDPLRSHVPNLRKDGSEPVSGWINSNDIEMFGVSVNLKYRF